MTSNPYLIEWKNGSKIIGFTTGAASGNAAASIRGQRADYIYLDEMDYLGEGDFDTVSAIAIERGDIGMFVSSTPTGRRSKFYDCCTNKALGYTEHYHPSMHNPNWNEQMESEFRAQLSELGYIHEVLAEFGPQQSGVFDKEKVDLASQQEIYAYDELTFSQSLMVERLGLNPNMMIYKPGLRAPINPFRTMGVDFDKYSASSSIIILDFNVIKKKFQVIRRVEVPRGEYSYDNAVNMVVELNEIYNPSWIYCDRGAGEYQIERLHMLGDKKPTSGLKNKVKGFQFKQKLEIMDPVEKTIVKEPMKPFMVNQLAISFERDRIILSMFDEVLHKQLIDYEVKKVSQYGDPVFSSENEHFVDALGLAHLAFVLEFPALAQTVEVPDFSTHLKTSSFNPIAHTAESQLREISLPINNPWAKHKQDDDLRGDKQSWYKVSSFKNFTSVNTSSWGSRGGRGQGGQSERSLW